MKHVNEIDWCQWIPQQRATLLFVIDHERVLLILKKRGLGAGNINGPGGRLEAGETPLDAAVREVQEELCITPLNPIKSGELFFQFVDGLSIHCTVFRSSTYEGTPQETDEAEPRWTPIDRIPYEQMWEDDQYWMPLMLNKQLFNGYFIFDGSQMLNHRIELIETEPDP